MSRHPMQLLPQLPVANVATVEVGDVEVKQVELYSKSNESVGSMGIFCVNCCRLLC